MADEPIKLSSTGKKAGSRRQDYASPPVEEVSAFHGNADTDSDTSALHHTLGSSAAQAAPGDHTHDGGTSPFIIQGLGITGTRGTAAWYASIEAILVRLGATNSAD